jgi:hypothetical protein
MKIDMRPRMCGKSHDLILKSAAWNMPIVCPTHADVERLLATARNIGCHIPCPIDVSQCKVRPDYMRGIKGVLVDDADRILQELVRAPIEEATWTGVPAIEVRAVRGPLSNFVSM